MENIQQAVMSAIEAKPLDFKAHIERELESKVSDALEARKQELAQNILGGHEESEEDSEDIQIDTEETDEEL
jgi:hypothetical protein